MVAKSMRRRLEDLPGKRFTPFFIRGGSHIKLVKPEAERIIRSENWPSDDRGDRRLIVTIAEGDGI